MVDANDQRAALDAIRAGVVLDQVHLPQRVPAVEPFGGQLGHAVLQRLLLVGRFGQFFQHQVVGQVELAVKHPGGAGCVFHHALAKAVIFEQSVFQALGDPRMLDAGLQRPDTHNLHQVGFAVHAQPGGVDLAHALA